MENITGKTNKEVVELLVQRYQKGKSTIYKRLEFLNIVVGKKDGMCLIEVDSLTLLDQLDHHLVNGGTMNDFELPGELTTTTKNDLSHQGEQIDLDEAIPQAESGHQMRQLVRSSQEKAAGLLMAQNILTAQFKDNPELLDGDLWEQVKATEEAIAPKSLDPKQYALSLVQGIQRQQAA